MKKILLPIVLVLILASCSLPKAAPAEPTSTNIPPTSAPPSSTPLIPTSTSIPPTDTSVPPTNTIEPTATILPTATPENQIFRDDFTGQLQPGWRWENENPEKWTITEDSWLQIIAQDPSLLGDQPQSNLLWRDLPEGNFAIIVHLKTIPIADFQQAAIFIYEDIDNYITINRGYCSPCQPGGQGIYMDYKISGQVGTYKTSYTAEEVYLKLESKDSVISGYYGDSPDDLTRLGRFGNYFKFRNVGIGVSNCGSESSSNAVLTGLFDYFEIVQP